MCGVQYTMRGGNENAARDAWLLVAHRPAGLVAKQTEDDWPKADRSFTYIPHGVTCARPVELRTCLMSHCRVQIVLTLRDLPFPICILHLHSSPVPSLPVALQSVAGPDPVDHRRGTGH